MKILHITESAKGGVASYLNIIVPAQSKVHGEENVFVCAPSQHCEQFSFRREIRVLGFLGTKSRLLNALKVALLAYKIVRNNDIQLVHIHSTFAGLVSRPLLRIFTKAKLVYCPHGWAWDRYNSATAKAAVACLEIWLSYFSDRVICISEHEMQSAKTVGLNVEKLEKICNGIPANSPTTKDVDVVWHEDTVRLLFVGRFDYQKGVDVFISAMKSLSSKYSAVMVGEFVVDSQLSFGPLPENVRHVGWLTPSQLQTLYEQADYLIMPSRWEGFGLVALEAMRAGCIVIASDVGGLRDVVADQETGLLVEPESPEAIVLAIEGLEPEKMYRMKIEAKKRVSVLFNADTLNDKLMGLYEKLCPVF